MSNLSETQKKAYIIADNKIALNSGWDDDLLKIELEDLAGLNFDLSLLGWDKVPEFGDDADYSILDDDASDAALDEMTNGVKKAIQIEFELEHYDEAAELVKKHRANGAYIGAILIEALRKGL